MGKYGEDSKLIYDLADQVGPLSHPRPSFLAQGTANLHSGSGHVSRQEQSGGRGCFRSVPNVRTSATRKRNNRYRQKLIYDLADQVGPHTCLYLVASNDAY